jgi:hypothetical protein
MIGHADAAHVVTFFQPARVYDIAGLCGTPAQTIPDRHPAAYGAYRLAEVADRCHLQHAGRIQKKYAPSPLERQPGNCQQRVERFRQQFRQRPVRRGVEQAVYDGLNFAGANQPARMLFFYRNVDGEVQVQLRAAGGLQRGGEDGGAHPVARAAVVQLPLRCLA